MKKVSFVMLMLLSAICLSACNSPSSVSGQFLSKEYVLSLEEVKDFYDEVEIKGVDKNKITLVSSNTNILSSVNGEEFKGISSGKAYVFAKYKNKTVAKAKVNVKYKLSSPQNFNLSTEGVLTWDDSYAVVNGEKLQAEQYNVEIAQVVEGIVGEYSSEVIQTNTITFPNKASYSVKITALSNDINVDNSDEIVKVFHYGVVGGLEEIGFSLEDDYASQTATITWAEKTNAKYDVYVEGFKLESDIEEEIFTFDYSIYQDGDSIQLEIIAKDTQNQKMSTSTKLDVNILNTPVLEYYFNKEGKLVWKNDINCSSYKLKITDYQGITTYKEVTDKALLQEVLEGYNESLYNVEIIAVGGENNGEYYVSSKPSSKMRVAKLAQPEVEVEFAGSKANITFANDDYVTDYKISWNGFSVNYSTTLGLSTSLDMSLVPKGGHTVEIIALPKADKTSESGVAEFTYGSDKSSMVLNSDKASFTFYVLDEIGEINHNLQGDISTFTFPSVTNANFYHLYINDTRVDANIFEENGIVTCQLANLKKITPKNGGYDIKVIAGRTDSTTGKEIATRSERLERIEILDAPIPANNQTNGKYAWNDLSEDCLYSYEVYKTGSDYSLTSGQTPIISEEKVDKLEIAEVLKEGYYKIRVKAISTNVNLYLDSDFHDANNVLEENFYVTKNIQEPSAIFFVDGEKYKLNISTVANASLYEIYVDGTLDGQLSSEGLNTEEYVFATNFENDGNHVVTIKALAGNRFDNTIYLASTEFSLNVNRLSLPEYAVNVVYTDFDIANHEWLTIKEVANSTGVKFLLNGIEVTGEDYRLDMSDYQTYGSEFKIGLTMQAGASEENNYYLNSHLKEINFVRADYPSLIKYTSGKLTWTQNQAEAEKNYLSLIVDNSASSDYYKRFEVEGNLQEFDLQTYINNLRKTDLAFDTAFRQVEKLQIKMLSFMNGEEENYYLPSFYGTTATSGTNTLEINMLESPVLAFNTETKVISWEYNVEGSKFDIYVDDILVKENYDLAKSISLSELGSIDFTTQKKVTIRAKNPSYLDSEISSAIYIKELTTPTSLNIAKDGNEYRASILISSDIANVSSVKINGSTENVNYTAGENIASFVLSDFADVTDFVINLIAKNEGNLNYYISSAPVRFTLLNLANQTFESTLSEDAISWTEVGSDIAGNNINPIRYVLTFENNGKTFTKVYENETSVTLAELETLAGQELSDEIKVTVKAIVSEDYSLSATSITPIGYYGEIVGEELTTHKLDAVSDLIVEIIDGANYSTQIDKKINSTLKITFPDKWTGFDNLNFVIEIKDKANPFKITLPQSGVVHLLYTFSKVGDNYQFILSSTFINSMSAGSAEISIRVERASLITSEILTFNISKFAQTSKAEVSDNGILTIADNQEEASYLVEITIEDVILERIVSNSEKILDLMTEDLILNRKGSYSIKLLTFDQTNTIIPASQTLAITGYKLQGIESVKIDDNGNINFVVYMDDLSEIIFTAKSEGIEKKFSPTLIDGSLNQFYISMLDLLEVFKNDLDMTEREYNFEFAVKDKGSLNSDWVDLVFNYAIDETPILTRGRDLDKDYLIFKISDKSETVSFRTIVEANFTIENEDEEGNITTSTQRQIITYSLFAQSRLGYWVTDKEGNNGFFATEKNFGADLIYTAGFWVTDLEGNNGYFTTENGGETDLIYTAGYWATDENGENGFFTETKTLDLIYNDCYAIAVTDILANLQYGWAEISISRIGKSGERYYQYNSNDFTLYKLGKINDKVGDENSLQVKDNFLTFSWTQKDIDDKASSIKPTAYYIIFTNSLGEEVKRITTYVFSVDLRDKQIGLTGGENYSISVKAVSAEKNIIASDSSASVTTLRYTMPLALQVEDGILTFDKSQFQESTFMQDIIAYFGQTDSQEANSQSYHNLVGTKQYIDPYYFMPDSLDDIYVTLQFTKVDGGDGVSNKVYTMTILGYWLFPDINIDFNLSQYVELGKENKASYYTLLQKYWAFKLLTDTSTEGLNTSSMIQTLASSPRGIGDNAILFDDLGRGIPSGEYWVSVIQAKNNQFIESSSSQAVKMYLSSAPEISLQTVVIDNLTNYIVDLTPTNTMINNGNGYEEGVALRYKLSLRPMEVENAFLLTNNLEFIIAYDGASWSISYAGNTLDGVILSNNKIKDGVPGFTINMSALKKVVNASEEIIPINTLMRADVFVYAQDDERVINGKSAVFNVRYLDLRAESIKFNGGKFIVESTLDNTYELLVKYKFTSQSQTSFTTKFEDGSAVLEFERPGKYEYIILSLNGSISSNTMNVESSSFAITNLYKLSAPTLSTSNLNLVIAYNDDDLDYMDTLEFNMANDISLHQAYKSEDQGYYYTSYITSNDILAPYIVGSKDINGNTLYPSELMASEFYAYLNGNSGTFSLSEESYSLADHLLNFSEEFAVMTSAQSSIKARMLAYIDKYSISEGHLLIDDRHVGINLVSNKAGDYLSGNLVYEVVIGYYVEDNANPGYAIKAHEETFYSERMYASDVQSVVQFFSGHNFNPNYKYFEVSVTVLGALRVDENTPNAILTVEGTYVLLKNTVYFTDDGAQVLRSQTQTAPYLLGRTAMPVLATESNGVKNGNISFIVDRSIYYADEEGASIDTAKRILVYAQYTQAGATYLRQLSGTYKFTTLTDAGEENNVYVTFTPDEGQLNDIVGAFDIRIYTYGNGTIISNPLQINEIYKLPNIDSRYYTIGLDGSNTVINLSKYFSSISINNDNACYKLVISYQLEGNSEILTYTLTSSSNIQSFVLPVNATLLSIQSQDGQGEDEVNPKKLLYSDTTSFNIQKTDSTELVVSWNAKEMRFEWEWADGNEDNYEYHVRITINGKTTTEIVTTNYYLPKDRGIIASGGFEIRARKLVANSDNLYTYSDSVAYTGEEISYSLFSGGNGSQSNPYLIRTKIDFINISKRNTKDFYFKLDSNISVSISDLYQAMEGQLQFYMQDFNAHLDGNGYTIEIISSEVISLTETYTPNLIGKQDLTFNEYSSLFRNISISASISNLFIDYVVDYESLNGSNILFSPLCAYNYGTIDNVKVSNVTISGLDGKGQSNTVFIGGIASVNYGLIQNCINSAIIDYTMAQQLNLTFGYAGITLFNTNVTTYMGSVINCYNQGSKNVAVTVNNSLVYMAGIALTNSGKISKAGNDGILSLSAKPSVTAMTGYYGGIVITNNNGTLEYVYNNAIIENTSNYGMFNYGGIAYSISSGRIKYLVVTVSGQPIVRSCTTSPSDSGTNYASSDSGTSTNIATKALSEQTIDCGEGYALTISQTDSGYLASITKA